MNPLELFLLLLTNAIKQFDETLDDTPPHQLVLCVAALMFLIGQYQNPSIMRTWRARHEKTPQQHGLDFAYELGLKIPVIQAYIERYVDGELQKQLESDLAKMAEQRAGMFLRDRIPEQPLSVEEILQSLDIKPEDHDFDVIALLEKYPLARDFILQVGDGKESGSLYAAPPKELIELLKVLYAQFAYVNPLREKVARVGAMQAEVISWALNLFHGSASKGYGLITHGGTSSIIEAMVAYVLLARAKKITHPEIVVPYTAHAAFLKAAELTGAKLIVVPTDPETGAVHAAEMEKYISDNTAVIVGSAPSFMYGINDPIADLGQLAVKKNVPLHVDGCLGGFLTAFLDTSNAPMDFRVPGVTSISADTHKYGYAPKGTSLLLFAEHAPVLSVYAALNWRGGFYATPGILDGSTSAVRVAEIYATMAYYGESRYKKIAEDIVALRERLQERVFKLSHYEDIHVFGDPQWSVLGFQSVHLNAHAIAQVMSKEFGWKLDLMQNPDGFHLCLTHVHTLVPNFENKFIADLTSAVRMVASYPPNHKYDGDVKAYGKIKTAPTAVQEKVAIIYERSRLFLPPGARKAESLPSSSVDAGPSLR